MAIDRQQFGWMIHCDGPGCAEELEVESPSHTWSDVIAEIHAQDWRSVKVGNKWEHLCAACREEDED